jgi:hypothetical protein
LGSGTEGETAAMDGEEKNGNQQYSEIGTNRPPGLFTEY